mgnify:CR=1 FL=1
MKPPVEIVEVGPRDGLQSQSTILDTETKLELVSRLVAAGVRRIEAASFVNPKRVPQMADADAVVAGLPRVPGLRYIGLVLNEQGVERALASGIEQLNCAVASSATFCGRNQGSTPERMQALIADLVPRVKAAGRFFGVTVATAFGCPFEGEIDPLRVRDLVQHLVDCGIDEIALADTIGVAVPSEVSRMLDLVQPVLQGTSLRLHFHDTRNTAVANVCAALAAGVRIFDASVGGLGGCPFAPGATGNVASEDLLYLFERMGYDAGISLAALVDAAHWLEGPLGAKLPAAVSRASPFPPVQLA